MSRNTEVMQTEQPDVPLAPAGTTRRSVLGAAVAVGAVGVVSACGGGGEAETPAASTSAASTEPSTAPASSSPPAADTEALTSTADVPVGGGVIIADEKVVITQPKAGEFKAFSSTCTT